MLVSVVIPAHNAEQWIAQSIESVVSQTYKNLEIIVIDDGSTDRTAQAAVNALENRQVPYQVISQANSGAAEARNRGWRSARGTWVQFLDADDLLHPKKIESQVATTKRDGSVDVVYSDWQKLVIVNGCWTPYDLRTPVILDDALADILSDRNFLQIGSLLFRVDAVARAGGFDRLHEPIEDVCLCVNIAIRGGRFVKAKSSGPMSFYRDLPRSLSKTSQRQFIESCIKNAKLAEQHIRTNEHVSQRTIQAIVDVYYTGARYFAAENRKRFEEIVADIEALQPGFVPKGPGKLALLSRIAGYRRAEHMALLYRKSKKAILRAGRHFSAR